MEQAQEGLRHARLTICWVPPTERIKMGNGEGAFGV